MYKWMIDPYSFSSMICSSTGGGCAFAAAFLAEAFFSFFFSFQLSTLFFQMGFPDSSFSSANS